MPQIISKPARDVEHDVDQVTFNIKSKSVVTRVLKSVEGERPISDKVIIPNIKVFMEDLGYTANQIQGVKQLFREIIANAYEIAEEDLIEDPFIDPPVPMLIDTVEVTDITDVTTTVNGYIPEIGFPVATQHGICWNTSGTPTIADSKTEEGAPLAIGGFSAAMTGLTPETTYYVSSYITNSEETVYGNILSFTTTA